MNELIIKAVFTHNPQDYFEGIEDPELSSEILTEANLPPCIAEPVAGGHVCIITKEEEQNAENEI